MIRLNLRDLRQLSIARRLVSRGYRIVGDTHYGIAHFQRWLKKWGNN